MLAARVDAVKEEMWDVLARAWTRATLLSTLGNLRE